MKFLMYALTITVGLMAQQLSAQTEQNSKMVQAEEKSKLEQMDLKSKNDSLSYSMGVLMAESIKQQGLEDLDIDVVMKGIKENLAGNATIDVATANQMLQAHIMEIRKMAEQKNAEKGTQFLADNAKKDGVKTTESGLQYLVIQEGDGATYPKATDKVTVHYHGTLIDGTVFDSSVDRGKPATFGLNQVISGWTEGLQLMSVGSKYRLFLPSNLAYGDRGAGGAIGPGSTLIFDVELLSIE